MDPSAILRFDLRAWEATLRKSTRRELIQNAATFGLAAVGVTGAARLLPAQTPDEPDFLSEKRDFFPGFVKSRTKTSGAEIHYEVGGNGPGLLLLHGYPQTHIIWRKIAPQLSEHFTLVMPDLRGYGDSSKPADGENHAAYSKRAMAKDQVELMASLGFKKFAVVGHDRGGRVAHRLALDHAGAVTKIAVLDIVPTYKLYHSVSKEFANAYFHWFFLIQPAPFPETLLGNNVEFFLKTWSFEGLLPHAIDEQAFNEYLRCFRNPQTIHASCEDYRASASIDLIHDAADLDRRVVCPLLALWAEQGAMNPLFDVLDTWRERAANVNGKALPGGHYLSEESSEAVLHELEIFLARP